MEGFLGAEVLPVIGWQSKVPMSQRGAAWQQPRHVVGEHTQHRSRNRPEAPDKVGQGAARAPSTRAMIFGQRWGEGHDTGLFPFFALCQSLQVW